MKVSVTQTSHQASQRHWKPNLCVSASEMPPSLRLLLKAVSRRAANEHSCRPRPPPRAGCDHGPVTSWSASDNASCKCGTQAQSCPWAAGAHGRTLPSTRLAFHEDAGTSLPWPVSSLPLPAAAAPGAPTSFLLLPGKGHPQPHCLRTPPPHPQHQWPSTFPLGLHKGISRPES